MPSAVATAASLSVALVAGFRKHEEVIPPTGLAFRLASGPTLTDTQVVLGLSRRLLDSSCVLADDADADAVVRGRCWTAG